MSSRGWTLFAAASVIWGMPYLFIKTAVDGGLTPGFVAWSRVTLAALVLLPLAWKSGALRNLPIRWLALFALAEIAIPFPLIGFGEQRVSSSLAAILIAALPLVMALLALRFDHGERPTRSRLFGMLIGLGGVVALVGIDIGGRGPELLGAGAILLATVGYAVGPLVVKRHLSDADPLGPGPPRWRSPRSCCCHSASPAFRPTRRAATRWCRSRCWVSSARRSPSASSSA